MSIVTKTGDKGMTGLFGGARISKADVRMHAIGTIDELNASLGVIYAEQGITEEMKSALITLQNHLFRLGADIASPMDAAKAMRMEAEQTKYLEAMIAGIEPTLPELQWFILPSGSRTGALLHQARAICRRAERWMVALGREETNPEAIIYINRLSDLLFLLARAANRDAGTEETRVEY
jgi:cob(I)alamin adenosyltransferase